jgi:hypothetical protein
MAAHSWKPSIAAQRIKLLFDDNKVSLVGADGMIFYGDQTKLPVTPIICVEAGQTARALAGVGGNGRVENILSVDIFYYYARVQEVQVAKLAAEQGGEAIADLLDQNPTLARSGDGGIVIHGFIDMVDPGYAIKQGTLWHAVRLRWTGKTKTLLGV